jgi:hypothetical protein
MSLLLLFNGFGTLRAVSSGQTRARAGLSATGVLGARAAARGAARLVYRSTVVLAASSAIMTAAGVAMTIAGTLVPERWATAAPRVRSAIAVVRKRVATVMSQGRGGQ